MGVLASAVKQLKHLGKADLADLQAYQAREKVRNQTGYRNKFDEHDKCERCGSTNEITRHHISYKPNRWIILCKKCHLKEHVKRSNY
jgi:hypothetical protein